MTFFFLSEQIFKQYQTIQFIYQMIIDKYIKPLKLFAIGACIFQIIVMLFYGLYSQHDTNITNGTLNQYYPWYQDVNVMMLVGFGYLMTFIKTNGFGAVGFTFLINCIVVQYYLLFQSFWRKVFDENDSKFLVINLQNRLQCLFAVASVLISYGAIIGRVGPLQLLIMSVVQIIGYSLNQRLLSGGALNVFDIGGSMIIHIYGAYFGLAASFWIGKKISLGDRQPLANYVSYLFSMLGTVFLWMYWPSFNSGTSGYNGSDENQFQRMITITNTIFGLTGSCLSAFAFSIIIRGMFNMDDIVNATLAGGVALGASSNLITNPSAAIVIGTLAGFVSTFGFAKVSSLLSEKYGIYDTCGIHNLHAVPGVIGGLSSAFVMFSYHSATLNIGKAPVNFQNIDFVKQGWIQIAGTFISITIGIAFGSISGLLMNIFYKIDNCDFFEDETFWQIPMQNMYQHHVKLN